MDDDLLRGWVEILGGIADVESTGRGLLDRWAEPHRRYHTTQHLREVLAALDLLCAGADVPVAVRCAAYWHDAVYEPTAPDNEQRSAALAGAALGRLGLAPQVIHDVTRLILLTTSHLPAPDDMPGALLCDADLAVLATSTERYASYAAGVRAEYVHLDDQAFRLGRAAVLAALLDRPQLFNTLEGQRRWERAARANLRAELDRLNGPSVGAAPRP